ncbi:MAG: WYL domain-containing protein [Actinomycetota bacterium]|nr:WYL domain-containing protein [Actinomycetota bacterium]
MAFDRAERLTNLLALLLSTPMPLSFDEIGLRLEGQYPTGSSAKRQAFERDKSMLRDLGVPIETEVMGGADAGRTGYRIDRERYELADLDLAPDERRALQLAVAAVRSGTPLGTEALLKLGAGGPRDDAAVTANIPTLDALPVLREAVATRSPVSFTYRDARRVVDPWGVALRDGYWYVIGHDHDRGEQRTFRVDRIDGDVHREDGTFDRPDVDIGNLLPSDPKLFGADGPPPEAVVAIDGASRAGAAALAELGDDRVLTRRDGEWVEVSVPCANVGAFGSWVLGLMDAAVVLAPAAVRTHVLARLTEPPAMDVDALVAIAAERLGTRAATQARVPGATARTRTDQRVRRALVMLPWLAEQGSVPLSEVATRFDLSAAEVEADIAWVSMCGLPPYVDEMIDVFVDEGMVHVGVPRLFTRPLRLTAPEGFALLAAGRAAMALPGADPQGPLGRGLAKLASALGDDDGGSVVVDLARPDSADDLADAVRRVERLELVYWSAVDDEPTTRAVTPRRLFADRGNWYLRGDDHRSGETRTFRLDRIESYQRLGEFDDPHDAPAGDAEWFSDGAIARATLAVRERGCWVAERYPVDEVVGVELHGERLRLLRLAVTDERWLTRLMVGLGADAVVIEPVSWRAVAAAARARLAALYGEADAAPT